MIENNRLIDLFYRLLPAHFFILLHSLVTINMNSEVETCSIGGLDYPHILYLCVESIRLLIGPQCFKDEPLII
jgi:hypothetical protein